MASHIYDQTRPLATPLCGATTGVCVDSERALCPQCVSIDAMTRSSSRSSRPTVESVRLDEEHAR